MDEDIREIKENMATLMSYFKDEPTVPGIFSRIRKNEEFRKLGGKVNWMLIIVMVGIIVKVIGF